jgi:hypothetical protein
MALYSGHLLLTIQHGTLSNGTKLVILFEVSHCGDYEDYCYQKCDAMIFYTNLPTFWTNPPHEYSTPKTKGIGSCEMLVHFYKTT